MTHWLHPEAEKELGDAAEYYLLNANPEIAEAFLVEYERIRDIVIENQLRAPMNAFGLRVAHFERFPYSLVYEDSAALGPQIFAIAHQRREPGYWRERG